MNRFLLSMSNKHTLPLHCFDILGKIFLTTAVKLSEQNRVWPVTDQVRASQAFTGKNVCCIKYKLMYSCCTLIEPSKRFITILLSSTTFQGYKIKWHILAIVVLYLKGKIIKSSY